MQITFDFDFDDYVAFQQHYITTTPALRRSFNIFFGIALIGFVALIVNVLSNEFVFSDLLFPLFLLIFSVFWLWRIRGKGGVKRSVKSLIKKEKGNSQVLGERTFLFENDYFIVTTTQSENKSNWSVIQKMDETPGYFFLYISNFMAYVIPKHKIELQVQNLQELLHQHIPQEKYKLCKK